MYKVFAQEDFIESVINNLLNIASLPSLFSYIWLFQIIINCYLWNMIYQDMKANKISFLENVRLDSNLLLGTLICSPRGKNYL